MTPPPTTVLVVCPTALGPLRAAPASDPSGVGLRALLDEVVEREDVETLLFEPVLAAGDPPLRLLVDVPVDRVVAAADLEPAVQAQQTGTFERTLLALGGALEAQRQALEDAGRAGAFRIVWMSALLESEYQRAHAYDVLGELSGDVTVIGVDARAGATAGDVSVARAALGMTDRARAGC